MLLPDSSFFTKSTQIIDGGIKFQYEPTVEKFAGLFSITPKVRASPLLRLKVEIK